MSATYRDQLLADHIDCRMPPPPPGQMYCCLCSEDVDDAEDALMHLEYEHGLFAMDWE
jgi:hypothetical protein